MISTERQNEMEECFWNETNDAETTEWRDNLTEEEKSLVETWNKQYNQSIYNLIKKTNQIINDKNDKIK